VDAEPSLFKKSYVPAGKSGSIEYRALRDTENLPVHVMSPYDRVINHEYGRALGNWPSHTHQYALQRCRH
jgi:hypothetical protein